VVSFGPVLGWFVLAGFLAGAAVALLNPPLPARVILGSAGLIVFAGTVIAGIIFTDARSERSQDAFANGHGKSRSVRVVWLNR
jgi:hypothetical protein